jgi:hypothetical protein
VLESYKDDKTRIIHAQKHGDFNSESEQEQLEKGRRHKRQRTTHSPSPDIIGSSKEGDFCQQGSSNKIQTPVVFSTLVDSFFQK